MSVVSPLILVPTAGLDFITSSSSQIISGTVPYGVTRVRYKYVVQDEGDGETPVFGATYYDAAISFTIPSDISPQDTLPWSFDCGVLAQYTAPKKILYLQFFSFDDVAQEISIFTSIAVTFTSIVELPISAPMPTAILVEQSNTALKVSCQEIDPTGYSGSLLGYNFYVSTVAGGGPSGYALMNSYYVTDPDGIRLNTGSLSKQTSMAGDIQVITSTNYVSPIASYAYSLTADVLNRLSTAGLLNLTNADSSTPFYFVVTSVLYDSSLEAVVESPYSPEVYGKFIELSAVYKEIPTRNRDQVSLTLGTRLTNINKKANILAGSVYRDMIDPISEEFADYYVIQDFIAQTQSIKSLLAFDDADGDGISDPVETSMKKTRLRLALKLSNAQAVQDIIDSYFDKKANNNSLTRRGATNAIGKALIYTNDIPKGGLYINDGATLATAGGEGVNGSPVVFLNKGSHFMSYEEKATFYNTVTKRYELEIDIESQVPGSLNNVAAGTIVQIQAGADPRLKVLNASPASGGTDSENNNSIANRTQLAIAGVDTGTEGGYTLKALGVGGVQSVRVEKAGDPLMLRDIDPSTKEHLGGKIDVYVQGKHLVEWQDVIAFSYSGPAGANAGEQFFIEDAVNFIIFTNNSNVTASTPIFEVIKVYNVTRSKEYDISGAVVGMGSGDTVQLAQNTFNLSIGMATMDVIEVDYRYRGSNVYVLNHQPVYNVSSVVGDVDGQLPAANYSLVKLEDPLLTGNSTIAKDGVAIVFNNGLPSSSTRVITGEAHYFVNTTPIRLAKKGVDVDTVVVSADPNGVITYTVEVDYTIGNGGEKDYTYLYLEPFSKIRSGTLVYVSYTCAQNFKITYSCNDTLNQVQKVMDQMKHAAADVIVKNSLENFVDISLQIIRKKGTAEDSLVNRVRTTLGNYINNLKVGSPLMLDDVISKVKALEGVKTLVLPMKRMMKMNGSFIQADYLGFLNFKVYSQNSAQGVTSYITVNPVLNYGTIDGGGPVNLFRSVYQNGTALVTATSALDVSSSAGRGYILSDGRIVVSTTDGTPPQTKEYTAAYYTYVVAEKEYAGDILVNSMESLSVDSNSITIDASTEEQ